MKTAGLLGDALEVRFQALLTERNWLVHRSRNEGNVAIANEEVAATLIARINEIADESRLLISEIAVLSAEFLLSSGVDPDAVRKATEEVIHRWEANDAI
jgi:hypothetical protein